MSTVAPPRPRAHARGRSTSSSRVTAARLGRYEDRQTGAVREIVSLPAAGGSRLLVDRVEGTRDDARLVGQLDPDEPPENERRLCAMYLADRRRGTCRQVQPEDFGDTAIAEPSIDDGDGSRTGAPLVDADGFSYVIRVVPAESVAELRWTRSLDPRSPDQIDPVTLRQVIGRFENYEPMRSLTVWALAAHACRARVSTVVLRGELARLNASRIVLNRALREAVAKRLARGELTASEIAIRCGRMKRDARGNISGETSWLGRRIGQLPDSGKEASTPWVHSDVLALIAREGLGICPHEVEVG